MPSDHTQPDFKHLVEHIERATADAVPAQRTEFLQSIAPGWLLPLDDGTVGRSHSAVPLAHAEPDLQVIQEVEQRYTAAGLPPVWRLPRTPSFDELKNKLSQAGYASKQPTCVQVGVLAQACRWTPNAPTGLELRVEARAFEHWREIFLGPGFDAHDAASRIQILARGQHTLHAVAYIEGVPLASGALSFYRPQGHPPLASVHGMRTLAAQRGKGLAGALLGKFVQLATEAGCAQWFLQVEEGNLNAQRLYAKLGFETAWVYDYWRK